MQRSVIFHLGEKLSMLPPILLALLGGMGSKVVAGIGDVGQKPCNRVEIVVAHHGERVARVNHSPDDHHRFNLLGSAINEIAHEYRGAVRMAPCPVALFITHLPEKCDERISLAMNVPNDVDAATHNFILKSKFEEHESPQWRIDMEKQH